MALSFIHNNLLCHSLKSMRIQHTDDKYKCIIINLLGSSYFLILNNTAVFVITYKYLYD